MVEEQQSLEQWLRRIEDDPGELLRRKFRYQYRQRQLNGTANNTSSGAGDWYDVARQRFVCTICLAFPAVAGS